MKTHAALAFMCMLAAASGQPRAAFADSQTAVLSKIADCSMIGDMRTRLECYDAVGEVVHQMREVNVKTIPEVLLDKQILSGVTMSVFGRISCMAADYCTLSDPAAAFGSSIMLDTVSLDRMTRQKLLTCLASIRGGCEGLVSGVFAAGIQPTLRGDSIRWKGGY